MADRPLRERVDALDRLLRRQLYILAALNRVLDHVHAVAEETLCDESDGCELAEWLAQFDLYEKEYRDMLQVRRALLLRSIAVQELISELTAGADDGAGGRSRENPLLSRTAPGPLAPEDRRRVREIMRRVEGLAYRMTGAATVELVRQERLDRGEEALAEPELDALDVDLGGELIRGVLDNILDFSEEYGIPLPQHKR